MKNLKTALALDWDVLARIEQDGIEEVDINSYVDVLPLFIFQVCLCIVAAAKIAMNYEVLSYRFYNGLYDFSLTGFIQLFYP